MEQEQRESKARGHVLRHGVGGLRLDAGRRTGEVHLRRFFSAAVDFRLDSSRHVAKRAPYFCPVE
eukprot:2447866-Prymnesium_polylepis.1